MKGLADLFKKNRKGSAGGFKNRSRPRHRERSSDVESRGSHQSSKKHHRYHSRGIRRHEDFKNHAEWSSSSSSSSRPSSSSSLSSSLSSSSSYASSEGRGEMKLQSPSFEKPANFSSSSSNKLSAYHKRQAKKKRGRKRGQRKRPKKERMNLIHQSDRRRQHHHQVLTREELFELPARQLRKKCKKLGLDTAHIAEKEGLVLLIHEYYRKQQFHQNKEDGNSATILGSASMQNNSTPTRLNVLPSPSSLSSNQAPMVITNNNITLPNDENEQMIEVLFEILPYYGQGDLSIDNIVKDTIQRLPFYCIESRDQLGGNTLLMISCQIGAIDLVTMLLGKGAEVNVQNANGETCLHFVCYNDSYSPDIAKILVNHGARAEVPEQKFGCTPLHWAASSGDIQLCKLLCYAGANARTVDKSGFDPIDYAKQAQKVDCVKFLQSEPSIVDGAKNSSNGHTLMKGIEDQHGFEKLVDNSTGYVYFHNWKTGESLWEEDYILFKKSLAKGGLRPIASSVSNGPPPPSHGFKSTSKLDQNDSNDENQISKKSTLDATAQGKDTAVIERLDSGFGMGESVKEVELKSNNCENDDSKLHQINDGSLRNVIGSVDAKIILSETDEDESSSLESSNSSMIEYDPNMGFEDGKEKEEPTKNKKKLNESNQKDENLNQASKETPNQASKQDVSDVMSLDTMPTKLSSATTGEKSKMVTQDSFNTRLISLQSRMEEQLNDQLRKMEEKINHQQRLDVDRNTTSKLHCSVSQLSERVVSLQSEVNAKELEIVSLKHQMMSLERDAASPAPLPKETIDAFVGNDDVRDEKWVQSCELDAVIKDKAEIETHIVELKQKLVECQSQVKTDERELKILRGNQDRGRDQVEQLEALLKEEKDAKNEIIVLLEQTQRGMQVDSEVAKSLEDDKRRSDEELKGVLDELKTMKMKQLEGEVSYSKEIEDQQRRVIAAQAEIESFKDELEKERLRHQTEKEEMTNKHLTEINDVRETMKSKSTKEIEILENRLREEKILRMQNEVERNDAVEAYENAIKTTKKAEEEAKRMSSMIEEAKKLIGTNERLHRSLNDEIDKRKALHNHLEDLRGKIRVYVRVRPLNSNEVKRNCKEALLKEDKRTCVLNRTDGSRNECKSWEFDQIFYGDSRNGNSQENVFKDTKRLVTSAIDGYNVCIFAYGQTGSGKTYTMFGPGGEIPIDIGNANSLNEDLGLAPRVASELFRLIEDRQTSFDITVRMNMFELYNDNVKDLMISKNNQDKSSLKIKLAEHSQSGLVEVSGAQTEIVESAAQLLDLFRRGSEVRTTASTKMNADSSRSHLITSITVCLKNKRTEKVTNGKMTLVDLAGSERVGKSGATGNQLKEAQSINKSLSALGDVINALTSGSKHIPYRNHPLTMLMSDSMGGNAKTLMFVCCSPADYNSAETCNALDFAKRCKDVTNNVVGGSSKELGQVKALRAELTRLKREKGESMRRKNGVVHRPGRQA